MFSLNPPTIMHIDLNSCFASVEQQANPLLRGKPVVVAAYTAGRGCILAASREAKKIGIKTGMRVRDAKYIYPRLTVLPPDPEKYRFVNKKLVALLSSYTDTLSVESIDEVVLDMKGSPYILRATSLRGVEKSTVSSSRLPPPSLDKRIGEVRSNNKNEQTLLIMLSLAQEIKQRINDEIGDWLTVSIGIAPNRYLAKIASNLHKPDGLDVITGETIESTLKTMKLEDLTGIKTGNANRLRCAGIFTPIQMYHTSAKELERAFRSIVGYHWWQRLHGYSEEGAIYGWQKSGGVSFSQSVGGSQQKSIGHSHALYVPYTPTDPKLHQILSQLVVKIGRRLRKQGFVAGGIRVSCVFASDSGNEYINMDHWGHGEKLAAPVFADDQLYRQAVRILQEAPDQPVRILAVTSFALANMLYAQESLFPEDNKKKHLMLAVDKIADRFGDWTIFPGRMLGMTEHVQDRIAFGKIKDMAR